MKTYTVWLDVVVDAIDEVHASDVVHDVIFQKCGDEVLECDLTIEICENDEDEDEE